MRVSPLRTTWTRDAVPPPALVAADVRGTLRVAPARMWPRSRISLRAARTPTVVRKRAAIPMRVSPSRTVYDVQPCGAGFEAVTTDAGSCATGGAVAGGAEMTMDRPCLWRVVPVVSLRCMRHTVPE